MHCLPCPQDLLAFQARELRKSFKDGDHVKVVSGRYEGETGLIVRIEHNLAILFSDLTMHEVYMHVYACTCMFVTAAGGRLVLSTPLDYH